jgi:site-specific DNA-methyltransferase (adenine-specific)
MWVYGSGFPKSLNVSKAIDKMNGAGPQVIGYTNPHDSRTAMARSIYGSQLQEGAGQGNAVTVPATDDARRWQGWGTALKPAHEPIVLARKPLDGTVAETVLTHGTGALNIDGCRVGTREHEPQYRPASSSGIGNGGICYGTRTGKDSFTTDGRWPANFIHDGSDEVLELFPEAEGMPRQILRRGATTGNSIGSDIMYEKGKPLHISEAGYGDSGSAARFFYCAKANKAEREAGLDDFDPKRESDRIADDLPGGDNPRNRTNTARRNHHPTVKPIALMRYLIRLVTPPNGVVLDPFTGSGTTGIAARLEGLEFVGIEQSAEYADIAQARINHA